MFSVAWHHLSAHSFRPGLVFDLPTQFLQLDTNSPTQHWTMTTISCNLAPFSQPCGISTMNRIECNKAPCPSSLTPAQLSLILSHLWCEFSHGLSYTALSLHTTPQPPGPGVISLTCVWITGPSPLTVTRNTGAKRPQFRWISLVARSTILAELPLVPNRTYTVFNPGCRGSRDGSGWNQGHIVNVPSTCNWENSLEVASGTVWRSQVRSFMGFYFS